MSREHARPQPRPAAAGTEEGQRDQPRCRSGSPAIEPSGPGAKLPPPGPHPAQPSSALDPGGERGPIPRLLAPLIAQLVLRCAMCSVLTCWPSLLPLPPLAFGRHCFTYLGPPNGPVQRPKPVRYVQYECYETTARSETRGANRGPICTAAISKVGTSSRKISEKWQQRASGRTRTTSQ
jgi:hypothetical protein